MGYSITLCSSIALIMALCCQLTNSTRPSDPDSDPNCIPARSVATAINRRVTQWDISDRIFIRQTDENQIEIYSYEKEEEIALFNPSDVVFEQQSAESILFTINSATSPVRAQCSFHRIAEAQAFFARVDPESPFSPQSFSLRRMERCLAVRGRCRNRETVSEIMQVFRQYFVESRQANFTFETVFGLRSRRPPTLTFSTRDFQLHRRDSEVVLVKRQNRSLYYILHFRGEDSEDKFMQYMAPFVDTETEYTFPDGLN